MTTNEREGTSRVDGMAAPSRCPAISAHRRGRRQGWDQRGGAPVSGEPGLYFLADAGQLCGTDGDDGAAVLFQSPAEYLAGAARALLGGLAIALKVISIR